MGLLIKLQSGLGILLGAVISLLVSFLVWPDRAEARFERHFRDALRATARRLDDALDVLELDPQRVGGVDGEELEAVGHR